MNKKNLLNWISDVREGCRRIIEKDTGEIIDVYNKGNWENQKFALLLQEIRDNERDDALLELFEEKLRNIGGRSNG